MRTGVDICLHPYPIWKRWGLSLPALRRRTEVKIPGSGSSINENID
jgi:hypothetical protein